MRLLGSGAASDQARSPRRGRHSRRTQPRADERRQPDRRGRRSRRPAAVEQPSLRIDPRIAARRAEVAAEAAEASLRRRRRVAVVTIVVVVLGAATGATLLSPLTSVRAIQVVGVQRTPPAEVRAASGLEAGPPLVRVDQTRTVNRIAALPWIKEVRLERRWPRTVVVTVEERTPAAVAPCQAGAARACLLDATGRVLAPTSADPKVAAVLPRLAGVPPVGPPGATVADAVHGALAVAVALPEALRPLVSGVRGEGGELSLDLQAPGRSESPPVVRLGGPDRIPEKLTAAATVLARTSVNAVSVLDVRVPEAPALTRVRR